MAEHVTCFDNAGYGGFGKSLLLSVCVGINITSIYRYDGLQRSSGKHRAQIIARVVLRRLSEVNHLYPHLLFHPVSPLIALVVCWREVRRSSFAIRFP